MLHTEEEIRALVFPNSLGFFFRLGRDCFVVMFLDVILVIANWDGGFGGRGRRLGSNAACSGRCPEMHRGFTGIEEPVAFSRAGLSPIPMEVLRVLCGLFTCNFHWDETQKICH